jgi:hypothetical protein
MFKKFILAIFVSTIIITGCSLFNFGGGDLMPLKEGNYWNNRITVQTITLYDTTDNFYYGRTEITGTNKLHSGKDVFVIKSGTTDSLYVFDTSSVNILYYEAKEDTAYFRYDSLEQETGKYLSPIKIDIGTIWNSYDMKYEVIAKENINVPAGTFNAYKVAITDTHDDTIWSWIASGKGVVKTYHRNEGSTHITNTTSELMSYEVK